MYFLSTATVTRALVYLGSFIFLLTTFIQIPFHSNEYLCVCENGKSIMQSVDLRARSGHIYVCVSGKETSLIE